MSLGLLNFLIALLVDGVTTSPFSLVTLVGVTGVGELGSGVGGGRMTGACSRESASRWVEGVSG